MRATIHRRLALAAAALAIGGLATSLALGQYGPPGGGMPSTGPGSIFKKEKDKREVVGLSLAATDEPVIDVRIVGNKTIPATQILNEMQTRVGRPYDPTLVQRDVRKLATRSWFVAVEPEIQQTPEGRIVIIKVVERPTIRYIEYLGNDGIRDKKLAKETGLKVNGSVDPYAVEEARRKIISLYHRSGYNDAQVSILEGNKPTDQGIVFVIDEGTVQKIWKVEFVGAEFVKGRRLKTQIESKPPLMMVFKGYVDREQIDADVDKLTAYYRSFGFFQAKVGRKLEYSENGNWATLVFVVHEGPRYEVRNVSFMGNKIFAESSLGLGAKLPAGQPFEQAKMNTDLRFLKELYGSQGYVFADIQAEPVFLEEPGKIDLIYHIEEGKQWRVGRIFVHIDGDNPHTRIQTALNRLSIRPGEIVDIREIHASERRLQASSLFLTDPARGTAPKITYKIQNLDEELARETSGSDFRGQSPDTAATPMTGQPAASPSKTYEVPPPQGFAPRDDMMDVHLYIEDTPQGTSTAPATPAASAAQPAGSPYQGLVVRTQSPYQPPTTQRYATAPAYPSTPAAYPAAPTGYPTVQASYPTAPMAGGTSPAAAYAATGNGGQVVRATGPDSAPVGYNAQPVQPAQYTAPLPPPPGNVFGPPTLAPGQPIGPPPGAVPDPNVTPILPNDPKLFPSGGVEPWARTYEDPAVDIFVDTAEAQTGRLMLGVAVNSDAGLFGQILLDEQNFNWKRWPTSMEDVVSGRAWRGGGERFRLEAMPGTQVQRYVASFQEPYLWDTPVSFGLSGSYYDRKFRDWSEQRLGGRTSFGYQWTDNDVSTAISYRGENVKIYDPKVTVPPLPELEEVIGSNVLHGFKLSVANDTRDSAFFATSGHYAELAVEEVLGSFTYPRATMDLRQYGLLTERPDHSGRHVLSYATQFGFSGDNTPIYDRFFAGGFSTLRGFDFRGASPVKQGVQVGGDFMWVNSLEYLFPLTADDMMHGVVFLDYGTVEENITLDWSRFRVAPGFGLRITIPAMGPAPIALDFAFPIAEADFDQKQVFSFNIGYFR